MSRVVIADTSCLIALSHLHLLTLLKRLFDTVSVTPIVVSEFGQELPDGLNIEIPLNEIQHELLKRVLDAGEASALALALERPGSLLLIDERKGRRVAQQHGIAIAGTLRLLLEAKQRGWIPSLRVCLNELKRIGFRTSAKIEAEVLSLAGETP
jgi:predicted nucleic acid-binding protein